MAKPWVDMSSAERLDAVLLAVHRVNDRDYGNAHGNAVAYEVMAMGHEMQPPRHGNHGHGNVARAMAPATRVTPALTALRNRGLLQAWGRMDGWSGSADYVTAKGQERVVELLDARGKEQA